MKGLSDFLFSLPFHRYTIDNNNTAAVAAVGMATKTVQISMLRSKLHTDQ